MVKLNNPSLTLKRLIIFFFFYMIFEGVIRKWIFPNFSTQIYFIKDFFLIIIYLIGLKYHLIFKSNYAKLFTVIILILSLFGFLGYDYSKDSIIYYIAGLRSYWIFLPLFLIIVHLFSKNDLIKFFKLNLFFIIPNFLLVLFQALSPESSIINSGFDGNLLSPERPSSYFTYTTQNTFYFIFLFYIFCSYVLDKKEFHAKDIIYLCLMNFLLISTMILLKGRSVYFYVFVTISYSSFFIIISNYEKKLKMIKIVLILFVSLISFNLSSNLTFEDQYEHSKIRMHSDDTKEYELVSTFKEKKISDIPILNKMIDDEEQVKIPEFCSRYSTYCRIINDLYIVPTVDKASFYGYGIGSGTKIVILLKNYQSFYLGEIDNKRIIMELGNVVGLSLVLVKWALVVILNIYAIFKFRDKNKIFYVPILVFISTQLFLGTVTYTVSFISFIFWMSLGLLFSSFRKINIRELNN